MRRAFLPFLFVFFVAGSASAGAPRGRALARSMMKKNAALAADAQSELAARRKANAQLVMEVSHHDSFADAGLVASLAIAGVALVTYWKRTRGR